jgi:hypothetical protein
VTISRSRKIRPDRRPIERRERRASRPRHRVTDFRVQNLEQPLHAGRTECAEAPSWGAPEADCAGAERDRLTISAPRRKPLSTRTGILPPTASTISGSTSSVDGT